MMINTAVRNVIIFSSVFCTALLSCSRISSAPPPTTVSTLLSIALCVYVIEFILCLVYS